MFTLALPPVAVGIRCIQARMRAAGRGRGTDRRMRTVKSQPNTLKTKRKDVSKSRLHLNLDYNCAGRSQLTET